MKQNVYALFTQNLGLNGRYKQQTTVWRFQMTERIFYKQPNGITINNRIKLPQMTEQNIAK